MRLLKKLRQFLGRKEPEKAPESEEPRMPSIDTIASDAAALRERFNRFKSLKRDRREIKPAKKPRLSEPVELQKDSLQLGIAAGYTGKFIRDVDRSLSRIESQMVSKDWFASKFEDKTPELFELTSSIKSLLLDHDKAMQQRFKSVEQALKRLQSVATRAPEPVKTDLMKEIETIQSQMPLSPKMEELVSIVKEAGEIGYSELCERLEITRSSLRGLLSNTVKRTDKLERFKKSGKGWVRYVSD